MQSLYTGFLLMDYQETAHSFDTGHMYKVGQCCPTVYSDIVWLRSVTHAGSLSARPRADMWRVAH
jgi:hypothetical protein